MLALIILAAAVVSFTFAGGGQSGSASGPSAAAANTNPNAWKEKYATPVTLTFGRDGTQYEWKNGEYFDNSVYSRYIKDTLNIDVKMAWIANNQDYTQRVSLAVASGDLPDVMLVNNRLILNQLFLGDMTADLTGLYDVYAAPVLKAMVDSFGGLNAGMSTTFYNGKQLAVSELNLGNQDQMFWVREDWRLKLGLPEPKTIDDFVSLAQAFVKNDMAGGGRTIGFEVNASPNMVAGYYNGVLSFDTFFNDKGAYPRIWHDDGTGKLVYGSVTPQAKEVLSEMHDMYTQGLIAKDFSTRDANASIANGYPGVIVGPWWTWGWPLYTTVQNNPDAIWKIYTYTGHDGKANSFQQNYNNSWHVVRKGHPNPEALYKILSLHAEFQCSNEAPTLTAAEKQQYGCILPDSIYDAYRGQSGFDWGAWPTRLTLRFNDHIIRQANMMSASLAQYRQGSRDFPQADLDTFDSFIRYESGQTGYDVQNKYMNAYGKLLQADLAKNLNIKAAYYPSVTPTQELRWANLTDMELLAYTKIIMGQEPVSYFDTFVRDWYAQGGTAITNEVNDQYRASK